MYSPTFRPLCHVNDITGCALAVCCWMIALVEDKNFEATKLNGVGSLPGMSIKYKECPRTHPSTSYVA